MAQSIGNKAHTATVHRICERYGGVSGSNQSIDIVAGDFLIEVELTPTIESGIKRLLPHGGRRYVAVTNKESIEDALLLTEGTGIGVMDPHGNIIRQAELHFPESPPTDDAPQAP